MNMNKLFHNKNNFVKKKKKRLVSIYNWNMLNKSNKSD